MTASDEHLPEIRLRILEDLRQASDYTLGEHAIRDGLRLHWGHVLSADALLTQLAWLDEQGLVTVLGQQIHIARITTRGDDVASGAARVPGVARPRPRS